MKISIEQEVLEQALNALIEAAPHTSEAAMMQADAIVALRQTLAQPEPGRNHYEDGDVFQRIAARRKQKARKPLTDAEICSMSEKHDLEGLEKFWYSCGAKEASDLYTFPLARKPPAE